MRDVARGLVGYYGSGPQQQKGWTALLYRINGHLSANQKNFNVKLSSKRVMVEQMIGLLKSRFHRLCTKQMLVASSLQPR